jgi:CDGSH-type Zn-finger protein
MSAAADPSPTRITPYRNGPYLVRGPFTMVDQDGNEIEVKRPVVALCRCGRSQIRPFCDGTHKAIGFRAESGPPTVVVEGDGPAPDSE